MVRRGAPGKVDNLPAPPAIGAVETRGQRVARGAVTPVTRSPLDRENSPVGSRRTTLRNDPAVVGARGGCCHGCCQVSNEVISARIRLVAIRLIR